MNKTHTNQHTLSHGTTDNLTTQASWASTGGSTPWKLATVFGDRLRHVITSEGAICPDLFRVVLVYAHMLPSDTQDIEGRNTIIKVRLKRFPNVGLELLNSRVLNKRSSRLQGRPGRSLVALDSEARHFAQWADAGFAVVQDRQRFFCDGWIYNMPFRIICFISIFNRPRQTLRG